MTELGDLTADSDGSPNYRVKGQRITWRRDPVILARMGEVQRLHATGKANVTIAAELSVDEGTVRSDLKRLGELWLEHIGAEAEVLRGQAVNELDQIKGLALRAADLDEQYTRAVLFGETLEDEHGNELRVYRDEKGRAEFRGQKAQHYNVARQAVMDKAKMLSLIVDRQEVRTPDLAGAVAGAREFDFDRFRHLAESVGRVAPDAARLAEADGLGQSVDTPAPD